MNDIPEEKLEKIRERVTKEESVKNIPEAWNTRPMSWPERIYENEYKPFPKWIKKCVRYGTIVLATAIALNHSSHHIQSFICQWWANTFC